MKETITPSIEDTLRSLVLKLKYMRPEDDNLESNMHLRVTDYLSRFPHLNSKEVYGALSSGSIFPSMRAYANSRVGLDREPLSLYNCMFIGIEDLISDLPRLMYALMCGTGVGYSLEKRYIGKVLAQKPIINHPSSSSCHPVITIQDSREGWVEGYREFLECLLIKDVIPSVDYSLIRPEGTPLRSTGGGVASGYKPLKGLMDFTASKLAPGVRGNSHLTTLDIYDICCNIANIVVTRRSATICLFDYDDELMFNCKNGDLSNTPWRYNCNNTAMYDTVEDLEADWDRFFSRCSAYGEPGFAIRKEILKKLIETKRYIPLPPEALSDGLKDYIEHELDLIGEEFILRNQGLPRNPKVTKPKDKVYLRLKEEILGNKYKLKEILGYLKFGLNPCGEIILRSHQLCNLSEVILDPKESLEEHMSKVEMAVNIGLAQGHNLPKNVGIMGHKLIYNTISEHLLGVSLSGIKDYPLLLRDNEAPPNLGIIKWLRDLTKLVAKDYWRNLGARGQFTKSLAITCVKPSGSVSKVANSSAGIHSRFSRYYLQNITVPKDNPLGSWLKNYLVPRYEYPDGTKVFGFPLAAPEGAIVADEESIEDQLNAIGSILRDWCDHNCSATCYTTQSTKDKDDLLRGIKANNLISLSIFPKPSDESLSLLPWLPLEKLTKEEYCSLKNNITRRLSENPIDWNSAPASSIRTSQEFSCVGGNCEII